MAKKHQPLLPEHPPQKTEWVVFKGRRKLCPVPWKYKIPVLKSFRIAAKGVFKRLNFDLNSLSVLSIQKEKRSL